MKLRPPGLATENHSVVQVARTITTISLATHLHLYSHVLLRDLRRLLSHANMLSSERDRALRQVVKNCDIVFKLGARPRHAKDHRYVPT
jgi:hypothetical protein